MSLPEHKLLLDKARAAAFAAGELLTGHFRHLDSSQISSKSSAVDLVSIADRESEELIKERLSKALPGAGFLGEESEGEEGQSGLSWIVDPLDGTSNFCSGLPIWSISIALCGAELEPLLGLIHAPLLGKTWEAIRGRGAFAGGRRLAVRPEPPGGGFENAMLATGFPYDVHTRRRGTNISYFARMQRRFHKIRRMGSAAIDLAYVAEGIFDGMWELRLMPWDTAAGVLLVEEAGGCCGRIHGGPYTPGDYDMIAAATPALLDRMRRVLTGAV